MDEMGAVEFDQGIGKHGRSPVGSAERLVGEGEALELGSGGRRPGRRIMAMPPPTWASPCAASQSREAARLRVSTRRKAPGRLAKRKASRRRASAASRATTGPDHLAAAEGAQRRIAREAAVVADDREVAGARRAPRRGPRGPCR